MIQNCKKLIVSPEILGMMLPTLYSSLIGASIRVRGETATLIGEIPSRLIEDAPSLLPEAFVALLNDRYRYVLSRAIAALKQIELPSAMKNRVRIMLFYLIKADASDTSQSSFLVDCIELFVSDYMSDAQLKGELGQWIIATLEKHEPRSYAQELGGLARTFADVPAVGRLVVKALEDRDAMAYHSDRIIRALRQLPMATIAHNREGLLRLGLLDIEVNPEAQIPFVLIEIFTTAGDWDGAEQCATAALAKLPDTRRGRYWRLAAKLILSSVSYERAIAEGRGSDVISEATNWKAVQAELREDPR
jgi:hypothetical protein